MKPTTDKIEPKPDPADMKPGEVPGAAPASLQILPTPHSIGPTDLGFLYSQLSGCGFLGSAQTWTMTQTVQPTADTNAALILKTSSPTQSAFLMEAKTSSDFSYLQVGNPEANQFVFALSVPPGRDRAVLSITNAGMTAATRQLFQVSAFNDAFATYKGEFYIDKDANIVLWHPTTGGSDKIGGMIQHDMLDNTDATFKGRLKLLANDFNAPSSGREFLRGEADGSAARIGFLGAAAVVRQANASQATISAVSDTNAKAALQSIYNLLNAYGLAPATA